MLPKEGRHGLVGHLDDLVEGRASELHVQVDGLDHLAGGQRSGGRVLRRGAGTDQGVRAHQPRRTSATSTTRPTRSTPPQIHYWTTPQKQCVDGSGDNCTAYDEWVDKWQQIKGLTQRGAATTDSVSVTGAPASALAFLLVPPMAWLVLAYLGSLAVLLVSAFWTHQHASPARWCTRSPPTTSCRVVTDAVFRMATRAHRRRRADGDGDLHACWRCRWRCTWPRSPRRGCDWLLVVAVTTPLWASYLVKAYAWRMLLSPEGPMAWATGYTRATG